MRHMGRILLALALCFCFQTQAFALNGRLFEVVFSQSGERFAVTEEVLAQLPTRSFDARPPDDEKVIHHVSGPLLRDVFRFAGMSGSKVLVKALDGYEMEIPMSDFQQFDVIAATEMDGRRLDVRDLGPAWILYHNVDNPDLNGPLYASRSVWQIKEIVVE